MIPAAPPKSNGHHPRPYPPTIEATLRELMGQPLPAATSAQRQLNHIALLTAVLLVGIGMAFGSFITNLVK